MPPPRLPGARLDLFAQQAREPMFLLGPDRRILMVNRAWEELTGHAADAVIGLTCQPHGPTRAGDLAGLGGSFCPPPEALAGLPAAALTLILHEGGERRWRKVDYWPLHDASGALTGLLGLVRAAADPSLGVDSEAQRLRVELLEVRDRLATRHGFDTIIGRGPEHRRLMDQIAAAALTRVPVLIVGDPGTGKRLVARTIHHQGPRRLSPMLVYDAKAIPPEVLDRELFGHLSAGPRPSGLAAPDGATLILGDILDLPRDLQARLASSLDGRVRLVATTAGDPDVALKTDRLRPDLYFAMTPIVLRLRPLRDRLDELPVLAQHFLERANLRGDHRRDGFSPAAIAALLAHDWPGNLRELDRVVDDAHRRGDRDLIQIEDIPAEIRGDRGGAYLPPVVPAEPTTLKEVLTQVERRMIERALERAGDNKSRAAKLLGINRPLLYRRIKELGMGDALEPVDESMEIEEHPE